MKTVVTVARLLLGVMFFVFGLNVFLHFIPAPPMDGPAGAFFGALVASHYHYFIFAVQTICGVLLLANQFVPLALALLAPVIANILAFHIAMQPSGLAPGLLAAVLWGLVASRYWPAFAPLLEQKPLLR